MTTFLIVVAVAYFLIGCYVAERAFDHDFSGMGATFFGLVWPAVALFAIWIEIGDALHIARENKKYAALRRAEEEDLI